MLGITPFEPGIFSRRLNQRYYLWNRTEWINWTKWFIDITTRPCPNCEAVVIYRYKCPVYLEDAVGVPVSHLSTCSQRAQLSQPQRSIDTPKSNRHTIGTLFVRHVKPVVERSINEPLYSI